MIETRDRAHLNEVMKRLDEAGYRRVAAGAAVRDRQRPETRAIKPPGPGQPAFASATGAMDLSETSSVHTLKLTSVFGPNVWVIGTSAASRP